MPTESNDKPGSGRLTPIDLDIRPFHRAEKLVGAELYWAPAAPEVNPAEKLWFTQLILRLPEALGLKQKPLIELFVEYEPIDKHCREIFIKTAMEFNPVIGLSRKPGAPISTNLDPENLEKIRNQQKPFDLNEFLKGVCYWFLFKQTQKQLETFWGFGGMTAVLVKPDPKATPFPLTIPPGVQKRPEVQEMNKQHDLQSLLNGAASLQNAFLKKSKEYFGKGWEERIEYPGLMYVLPRLGSAEFFQVQGEYFDQLFDVCEVFIAESPADKGVLFASRHKLTPILHDLIKQMEKDGVPYPWR